MRVCEHFEETRGPHLMNTTQRGVPHAGQRRNWELDVLLRWLVKRILKMPSWHTWS